MSNQGSHENDHDLLADLKQDERNSYKSQESQATKEHIAGAQGKLATAISQQQGDSDINTGARDLSRNIEPSGEEVNRDKIQESLEARAEAKIVEHTNGEPTSVEKGSDAARLQSAAEQYSLAREGKQSMPESRVDKKLM